MRKLDPSESMGNCDQWSHDEKRVNPRGKINYRKPCLCDYSGTMFCDACGEPKKSWSS